MKRPAHLMMALCYYVDDLPHSSVRVPPLVPRALAQMMQSCTSFSWAAINAPS